MNLKCANAPRTANRQVNCLWEDNSYRTLKIWERAHITTRLRCGCIRVRKRECHAPTYS